MEITQQNFKDRLPDVLDAISKCDFMAFDCEFSGLGIGGLAIMSYDTPTLVYDKAKKNIGNFTVMQFGLATFNYDAAVKRFQYRAFNFYVFPRLPKSLYRLRGCISDQFTFAAQADCMEFLAGQNFDFNKWIKDGVGYLREAEVESLSAELKRRYTWKMKSGRNGEGGEPPSKFDIKIPEHAASGVKKAMVKIKQFVADPNVTEMTLNDTNLQERRVLLQLIEKDYPSTLFAHGIRLDDGGGDIFIRKCASVEDHDRMQQEKLNAEVEELEEAAGFCKVIKAMAESRKPLLGHNLFYDLLHLIQSFCCPLPEQYDQFKTIVQHKFPKLIDTKVLAGQYPLKAVAGSGMSLGDLQRKVVNPPFFKVPFEPYDLKYGYEILKENLHEAGYDALVTGFIFIHLANYFGDQKAPTRNTHDVPWDLIRSLMGKITPGRIVDMPYISLATPDLVPDRRHVFHISFNSRVWTNHEIMPLFSPYGQVFINWIDERSAFVSLKTRDQAVLVKLAMIDGDQTASNASGWRLQLATDFLAEMEQKLPRSSTQDEQESNQQMSTSIDDPMGETGSLKRVRCS